MKKELGKQEQDILELQVDVENTISIAEQEGEYLKRMTEDALQSLENTRKSQDGQDLLSQKHDRAFYQSGSKRKKR